MPLSNTLTAITNYKTALNTILQSTKVAAHRMFFITSNDGKFKVIDEPLVNAYEITITADETTYCKSEIEAGNYPGITKVYNSVNGRTETYNGTTWVYSTAEYTTLVKPGRVFFNRILRKGYHSDLNNVVRQIVTLLPLPPILTLTHTTSRPTRAWSHVNYMVDRFFAFATGGGSDYLATSTDGINWTANTSFNVNNAWRSSAYGNSTYVVVSSTGTNRAFYSTDGITWTPSTPPAQTWRSVVYALGLFVAVAESGTGNRVMTSPDGITWTSRTTPAGDPNWRSVCYGNGLFVAVAWSGTNRVMTSPDGINWTLRASANDAYAWNSVCYGNGKFVAVTNSADVVMYSTDGVNWLLANTPDIAGMTSVAFTAGKFVASAISGVTANDRCMASEDGIDWTIIATPSDDQFQSVVGSPGGVFVLVGSQFGRILYGS